MKITLAWSPSRYLDALVRPDIRLGRRVWPAYCLCLLIGIGWGISGTAILAALTGRSPWVVSGVSIAAVVSCLSMAIGLKILTGRERYTFYHYQLLVIAVSAALFWWLERPALPYLDLIALGLAMTQACGRVGCLMAGCCHGRPHHWGVCYRVEHIVAGFPRHLVGVRLFPVQAVESLWALCIVTLGSGLVLMGHPPGKTLAWYLVACGAGRFCLEFVRGDTPRPYFRGFSEAQWTSLLVTWVVVAAEFSGILPLSSWHLGVSACLTLAIVAIVLGRRLEARVYFIG
jgi:hypothetical protein